MRNVILDLAVTLDGFIEGLNGEIDWCIIDEDMNFDGFLSPLTPYFMVELATIFGETSTLR